MVEVRGQDGKMSWLHPDAIARVDVASASCQWHGIRCYVRCFDGRVIESSDMAGDIVRQIEAPKPGEEND